MKPGEIGPGIHRLKAEMGAPACLRDAVTG